MMGYFDDVRSGEYLSKNSRARRKIRTEYGQIVAEVLTQLSQALFDGKVVPIYEDENGETITWSLIVSIINKPYFVWYKVLEVTIWSNGSCRAHYYRYAKGLDPYRLAGSGFEISRVTGEKLAEELKIRHF